MERHSYLLDRYMPHSMQPDTGIGDLLPSPRYCRDKCFARDSYLEIGGFVAKWILPWKHTVTSAIF